MSKIRFLLGLVCVLIVHGASAEGLDAARLGVIFNADSASSRQVAEYYAAQRGIPAENLIAVHLPDEDTLTPEQFAPIRSRLLEQLPTSVQSLLLVWSKPFAVGCMSITSAFAAGWRSAFCTPGCSRTLLNPLYDSDGWLPADTVGWWPSMLLPSDDVALAKKIIQRGRAADQSAAPGTLYLVQTSDKARNARAAGYPDVELRLSPRVRAVRLSSPVAGEIPDAIGYFTGIARVDELPNIRFRPGAVADHLTSFGGILSTRKQMPATAWLEAGATASYGSVSEPCSFVEKFPDIAVLFEHYVRGETVLEAYWKSVAMPGQGLLIGEPLARPYGARAR